MTSAPEAMAAAGGDEAPPGSFPQRQRIDVLVRRLFFLVPLGIAGNVIFTLATTDKGVLASVVRLSPGHVLLAMIFAVVPWFTDAARMSVWSAFLGRRVPYGELLKIVVAAELGAAILPPAVGGTPVKAALLVRKGFSGGAALSLTLLSGLEDWVFFLIMVPAAITLSSAWNIPVVRDALDAAGTHGTWIAAVTGLVIVLFLAWRNRRSASGYGSPEVTWFERFWERARHAWREFAGVYRLIAERGKSRFLITMALTAVQWACRYSIVTLLVIGLGVPARPMLFFALQVIVFGLAVFVPTPGAVGGAEALFYALYRPFVTGEALGLVTAGWRFLTFYFLLLVSIFVFYASGMDGRRREGDGHREIRRKSR
jgi:uncharacterized protein (TIRG00374 family)